MTKKVHNDLNALLREFANGKSLQAYNFMGCHKTKNGHVFRVWAPNAESVFVVGSFNNWNTSASPMHSIGYGVWEAMVNEAQIFDEYKYYIIKKNGKTVYKSDPYAFHACTRPENASKVYDLDGFKWTDSEYCSKRAKKDITKEPMNIYEVHLGSWHQHEDGNFLSYTDT